jgi:cardiolipin synthase
MISICSVLAASLLSCKSPPEPHDFRRLPEQFADEQVTEPLIALEAFRDESDFYVRYRDADGIVYAGGNWAQRIQLTEVQAAGIYAGPYTLPLQFRQRKAWTDPPTQRIMFRILGQNEWNLFRDQILASVMPEEVSGGLVLHFYVDDYFLYYDDSGKLRTTLLQNKPADQPILAYMDFGEFFRRGAPVLEEFLALRGISERDILFNTGDVGAYSLPFLYVNRDLPMAVFARHEPTARKKSSTGRAMAYLQTAGHVAQSHLVGIALRPFSSISRLFFVSLDRVREAAKPDWLVELEATPIPPVSASAGMDLDAWEEELDELTGRKSSKGTIEYLVDGEEFFPRLIDTLSSATDAIHLRTYIFDNDDFAEKIGRILKRRSNEGVDVKLLFDGLGTIISTIEQQPSLPEEWAAPASVRRFLQTDSRIEVRQAPNPWLTGDHVKVITIDHRIAFTGGMNIAREYRYDWHDLMMEVHGPVVDILQNEFQKAWAYAGPFGDLGYLLRWIKPAAAKAENQGHPVRVLFTRLEDPEIFKAQLRAIRSAERYIYVENAYFTDDAMLYELVKARKRGVDVRVIMPLVTDRGAITRNNALAANSMLRHGVRIYVYPGMSHVKAAIFDGWACLGSANWDKWSLSINNELNLATSHPEAVDRLLKQVFEPDLAQSVELTEPFPERWSDFLLEMMGDYIF